MKKNKNLLIIVLFITILFYLQNTNRNRIRVQSNLIESLDANLTTWKDKDSLNRARIQVIETQKTKDFLALQSNDSLIKRLQDKVNYFKKQLKDQGVVTVFDSETNVKTTSKTEIIVRDTIRNNTFPEYKSNFNLNDWVIGNTISNKDSTTLTLKIKNSYSVIVGKERKGLFKKSVPFVEVINENPYTETKSLRTYQVKLPRQKRFGIGPTIGVGINNNFRISPFLGIGVQYNLIKF